MGPSLETLPSGDLANRTPAATMNPREEDQAETRMLEHVGACGHKDAPRFLARPRGILLLSPASKVDLREESQAKEVHDEASDWIRTEDCLRNFRRVR